jgi:hypothetical protein
MAEESRPQGQAGIDPKSGLSKRQRYEVLRSQLDQERSTFISHWRSIGDLTLPRRPRFNITDVNRGDRRNQQIIDCSATLAIRTLRAGFMGGVTSPARPWFRLTTPDPDMAEIASVKDWLFDVSQRMYSTLLKSNYYNVKPIVYGDLGTFGTAPYSMEEDFEEVLRCQSFPIGSYMIAKDFRGRVNTFMRDFRMTVQQLVEQFGFDEVTRKIDWSRFSSYVKQCYERNEYQTWVDVCHVIQPNPEYNPRMMESKYKKFVSCYYERGNSAQGNTSNYIGSGDESKFLRESGYDYFPILCPRWEVTGEDVYGTDCPGMTAIGDIKQLQWGERKIAKAIDKMIDPPMTGPTSLKNQKSSILPGDITFLDTREGQQGFRPAHEVQFRIDMAEQKQQQVRDRIRRAFFEDLFLMLANDTRSNVTAREVEERHEEKLLALGPVLEQLNQDDLDPSINITFDIMNRQGLLPPPPEELQGMALKVEYISVMAQAQKLVGIGGTERFAGFVGQLAQMDPTVLQKVDFDQMVDEYGDALGISPKVIRSDDEVDSIRAAQAQQQQAQQKLAAIQQSAETAKSLSETNLEGDNALNRMIQQSNSGALQ